MQHRVAFGRCQLWPVERVLLVDGQPAAIGARAFDVLCALVAHRDRVVSRTELLDQAWAGLVVEENNLSVQISALRKLLGAGAITTVAGRGYRFSLPVHDTDRPEPVAHTAGGPPIVGAAARPDDGESDRYLRAYSPIVMAVAAGDARPAEAAGAPAPAWHRQVATDISAAVLAHGGRILPGQQAVLMALFSNARAAAACALKVHRSMAAHPQCVRIALYRPTTEAGDSISWPDANAAQHLACRAAPGETILTATVAGQLTVGLDGDLEHAGDCRIEGVAERVRIYWLSRPRTDPSFASDPGPHGAELRPMVAVLPFRDYRSDAQSFGIGDIFSDQIIGALSRSAAIGVTSRLSTHAFRDRAASLAEIAGHLSAQFLVSGRYWCNAGRLTASVELADARSGVVLWSHLGDDDEGALLQADSRLLQDIANGVTQAVFGAELRRARSVPLPSLASHTLMLAAVGLLYRLSRSDFDRAKQALDTLCERAPRHAAPQAWLARWYLFRIVQGWTDNRERDGALALEHASRALELDPDSSLALTMLGNVHTNLMKDLDGAEALYDKALLLNPSESLAWLQKGNARSFKGDGAAALAYVERAVKLSPLDPARHYYQSILSSAALSAGEYEHAITAARLSLRLNNDHVSTHRVLTIALALTGRMDEARAAARQVLRLEPGLTVADFIARSPGAASGLADTFGRALHAAGLPWSSNARVRANGG